MCVRLLGVPDSASPRVRRPSSTVREWAAVCGSWASTRAWFSSTCSGATATQARGSEEDWFVVQKTCLPPDLRTVRVLRFLSADYCPVLLCVVVVVFSTCKVQPLLCATSAS